MIVKVRKEEFNIGLVSNYVHKLYSCLVEASFKLSDCSREAQDKAVERAEQVKDKPKLKELKVINENFTKEVNSLNEDIKNYTKEITDCREAIIRELIETNGYDYDPAWWERRTSPDDLNNFMLACLGKDQKDNKSYGKKK